MRMFRGSGAAAPGVEVRRSRVVSQSETLEPRVLFALAAAAGGSGYSADLSTNSTIRQQQLICDPAEPKEGSTSVRYDPAVVTLVGYQPGPGYNNLGFLGYVEVRPSGGSNTVLQPLVAFLSNPLGMETGYVQVQYKLQGKAGQLSPPAGYTVVEHGGVEGVDTHSLMFKLKSGVPLSTIARYQVYAAKAGTHSNNTEDHLVTNDGTNTYIGPANLSPAFASTDKAPVITSTGGAYTIAEGSSLTLKATATDAETSAANLSYAWDLNGDGVTDATGVNPTVSAAQLATLGLADGPKAATIKLTVGDGDKTTSSTTTLNVTNVAPTVGLSVTNGSATRSVIANVSATDPSAADRAAGFTYLIKWGDGTTTTVPATANNGAGVAAPHTYAAIGSYTVTVTATDKDGGVSTAASSASVSFSGAQLLPDPSDPTKLALFVFGTNGNDTIRFAKSGGGLAVTINNGSAGTFKGFTRVIAYGLAGNDDVRLYDAAGVFFGGDGDDTLVAGNFVSLLSGGEGNDSLSSGNAKDVLIGGGGADKLDGGTGDDVLVAGRTSYDAGSDDSVRALTAIFNEWNNASSYDTSIARITGAAAGGLNGQYFLKPGVTVFDDGAVDTLLGNGGRDWFLLKTTGVGVDITDAIGTETKIAL